MLKPLINEAAHSNMQVTITWEISLDFLCRALSLTKRQFEVWVLITKGFSTEEIATALKISPKCVESHRARLMKKLQIDDRLMLAVAGIAYKIVSPGYFLPDFHKKLDDESTPGH